MKKMKKTINKDHTTVLQNSIFTKGICSACKEVLYEHPIDAIQNNTLAVTKMISDSMLKHDCNAPIDRINFNAVSGEEIK